MFRLIRLLFLIVPIVRGLMQLRREFKALRR